jgi:hypothetical protein
MKTHFTWLIILQVSLTTIDGLCYKSESETRQVNSLDSGWSFRLDEREQGETEKWFLLPNLPEPTIRMPVTSSYNDITQNMTIHQYIG